MRMGRREGRREERGMILMRFFGGRNNKKLLVDELHEVEARGWTGCGVFGKSVAFSERFLEGKGV